MVAGHESSSNCYQRRDSGKEVQHQMKMIVPVAFLSPTALGLWGRSLNRLETRLLVDNRDLVMLVKQRPMVARAGERSIDLGLEQRLDRPIAAQ